MSLLKNGLLTDVWGRVPEEWRGEINIIGEIIEYVFPTNTMSPGTGDSGVAYTVPLGIGAKSARLNFSILFPKDFDHVRGGKALGLSTGAPSSGCVTSADMQGMSARFMFNRSPDDKLVLHDYRYRFGKTSTCGEVDTLELIAPGAWNDVSIEVDLNTFTSGTPNPDGRIKYTVNGVVITDRVNEVVEVDEVRLIDYLMVSVFFGGGDPTYRTRKKSSIFIKNLEITHT